MKTLIITKEINPKTEFKEQLENIRDLYIYKDDNKKTLSVMYNDEQKVSWNLEKIIRSRTSISI